MKGVAMQEQEPALLKDQVLTRCRNGRCYYNPQAKLALTRYAALSGKPISALASRHGIAATLLRRWLKQYRKAHGVSPPMLAEPGASAFVPVAVDPAVAPALSQLTARLPNGIDIALVQADPACGSSLLELLWRLPCSASTKG
jgi:transposase